MKRVDLSGSKFGLLVVNAYAGLDSGGNAAWSCLCDCGASVVVRGSRLRSGETASCGCLRSNSEARSVVVRGDGSLGKGDAHRSIYNTPGRPCGLAAPAHPTLRTSPTGAVASRSVIAGTRPLRTFWPTLASARFLGLSWTASTTTSGTRPRTAAGSMSKPTAETAGAPG